MKSPFAIFRKHQKMLMAVLTGLSMFAFVVLDSLTKNPSTEFVLPILCALAVGGAFALLGRKRGESMKFGTLGVLIGILIGIVVVRSNLNPGPKAPVETQAGNLSNEELRALMGRRQNANNFMRMAFEKVAPFHPTNRYMAQLWEQQLNARMFGFGSRDEDLTDDVVIGFLLDKEADDMGITLSDDAVSDYINRVNDNKLTHADFAAILKQLNLSESELFDDIRGELRAKLAMEMLIPRATPTPEQYWEDYRKLYMTESLDVAAVPVDDFLAAAPMPTDAEITEYFNAWKEKAPNFPGADGLLQPRRISIEYLEADSDAISKQVETRPVAEQEIKKYYDDHREQFRNPAFTSSVPALPTAPTMHIPELKDLIPETPSAPAGSAPQKSAAPANNSPPSKAQKGSAPSAAPSSAQKPAPPATGGKNPPAKQPAGHDSGKPGAANERPNPANSADGELLASAAWLSGPLQLGAYQPGSSGSTRPAAVGAGSKSAAVHEPPAPALPESPGESAKSAATKGTQPEPEYRPLDDAVKKEIREFIVRQRTEEEMKTRIKAAFDFMSSLHERLTASEPDATSKITPEQRIRLLTDYAAEKKLKYVRTPLMSYPDLQDSSDKYPIAFAAEPMEEQFSDRQPVLVLRSLFLASAEQLYVAGEAVDFGAHRFSYWKVADVAQHVPKLDEPGVREAAVRALKIANFARKKAKERADELAELIRKSKKPMAEALANQTVTKADKGPKIHVVSTPPFSWLTVQSAAPQGLQSDAVPRLSEIPGVKEAGDEFMRIIFNDMKPGDVRVVPDRGQLILYVLQVKTRHPDNEAEMAAFRARFLKENLFGGSYFLGNHSTYDYLNMPEQEKLAVDWTNRLMVKYGVHRNREEEQRAPRRRNFGRQSRAAM